MKYDGKTFMLHSFMYKGHRARICTSCVVFWTIQANSVGIWKLIDAD